jgi:flagellar biosynthesis/type III secretory pathway chaperone
MTFPKTREEEHRDSMLELHEAAQCSNDPKVCWACEENDSNPVYTGEQARELLNEAVQIIRKVAYNRIANQINGSPLEHAVSDINAAILDLEDYK